MSSTSNGDENETNLCQLVYLSSASAQFSKEELVEILKVSRRNNTAANVTGLLLYHQGNIIQFLEGDAATVQSLYDRINLDSRHKGVLTLLKRRVQQRDFGSWSMGFKDIAEDEKESLEGFNDLMSALLAHQVADPAMSRPIQRLIRSFRQVSLTDGYP